MAASLPVLAHAQPSNVAAQPTPVIYNLQPASAAPGEQLTILGRGFSTSNTVRFGKTSIPDVAIAWAAGISCVQADSNCHPGINQALAFTVPRDAAARQYDISVENGDGVSNVVTFTLSGPLAPAR
jgi:hypothetical protein